MAGPGEPLFLARQSYRRRRVADAARFLPLVGVVLLLLPVLWADTARTAGGIVYVFAVWSVLIVAAGILSRRLAASDAGPDEPES